MNKGDKFAYASAWQSTKDKAVTRAIGISFQNSWRQIKYLLLSLQLYKNITTISPGNSTISGVTGNYACSHKVSQMILDTSCLKSYVVMQNLWQFPEHLQREGTATDLPVYDWRTKRGRTSQLTVDGRAVRAQWRSKPKLTIRSITAKIPPPDCNCCQKKLSIGHRWS